MAVAPTAPAPTDTPPGAPSAPHALGQMPHIAPDDDDEESETAIWAIEPERDARADDVPATTLPPTDDPEPIETADDDLLAAGEADEEALAAFEDEDDFDDDDDDDELDDEDGWFDDAPRVGIRLGGSRAADVGDVGEVGGVDVVETHRPDAFASDGKPLDSEVMAATTEEVPFEAFVEHTQHDEPELLDAPDRALPLLAAATSTAGLIAGGGLVLVGLIAVVAIGSALDGGEGDDVADVGTVEVEGPVPVMPAPPPEPEPEPEPLGGTDEATGDTGQVEEEPEEATPTPRPRRRRPAPAPEPEPEPVPVPTPAPPPPPPPPPPEPEPEDDKKKWNPFKKKK